ncbi:MAG: phosphatase PAP2 family protein [Planctomycetota bacterium]|nr:MAG: phosphatase PAP2 family protein [Planctomycetota bacterium]
MRRRARGRTVADGGEGATAVLGGAEAVGRVAGVDDDPVRRAKLIGLALCTILFYFVINRWSVGRPAHSLHTVLDTWFPFSPPWQVFYFGYLFFLLIPVLMIRDVRLLGRAVAAFVFVQLVAYAIFLVYPVRMHRPTDFAITDVFTWGVAFTYFVDPPYNCFPSLHLGNAVLTALIAWRLDRKVGGWFLLGAALIALSTVFVRQHYVLDVLGGAALAWIGYRLWFRPAVPDGPRPGQLYPRRWLLVIPALYLTVLLGFYLAYRAGWQPFPWPLPS